MTVYWHLISTMILRKVLELPMIQLPNNFICLSSPPAVWLFTSTTDRNKESKITLHLIKAHKFFTKASLIWQETMRRVHVEGLFHFPNGTIVNAFHKMLILLILLGLGSFSNAGRANKNHILSWNIAVSVSKTVVKSERIELTRRLSGQRSWAGSSVSVTQVLEGKSRLLQVVLWSLYT